MITEILREIGQNDQPGLPVDTPADLALSLARIVENSMGGSSGAVRYITVSHFGTSRMQKRWIRRIFCYLLVLN